MMRSGQEDDHMFADVGVIYIFLSMLCSVFEWAPVVLRLVVVWF